MNQCKLCNRIQYKDCRWDIMKQYKNYGLKSRNNRWVKISWSRAVDGKRFLESNASSIPGTYTRVG